MSKDEQKHTSVNEKMPIGVDDGKKEGSSTQGQKEEMASSSDLPGMYGGSTVNSISLALPIFKDGVYKKNASELLLEVITGELEIKNGLVDLLGPPVPGGKRVLFPSSNGVIVFEKNEIRGLKYPSKTFVGHMAPYSHVEASSGPLNVSDSMSDIEFPLGLTLIVADTGGGKTVLMCHLFGNAMQDSNKAMMLSMGEPEAYLHGDEYTLCRALVFAAQHGASHVFIDSFRTLFNEMGGSLKSQGISRSWDGFLSSVDRTARYLGIRVVATLNPSTDVTKNAKQDLFVTAKASCSGAIMIDGSRVSGDNLYMDLLCHSRDKRRDYGISLSAPLTRSSDSGEMGLRMEGFLDFNMFKI